MLNRSSEVSYHFLISRTGEIVQFVDIRNWAYANGTNNSGGNLDNSRSTLALVRSRRVNANWYTVSIAFADMPSGNPSKEQLAAAAWLMRHVNSELQRIYGSSIPIRRDRVVGHGEITPVTRAHCPGKAFPFDELIRLANGSGTSAPAPTNPPNPPTPPATNTTFRVIAGSYKLRSNANKQLERLKKLGFKDCFLHAEPVNGVPMFRVVVGSFRDRNNANQRLADLKRAGVNNGFLVAVQV